MKRRIRKGRRRKGRKQSEEERENEAEEEEKQRLKRRKVKKCLIYCLYPMRTKYFIYYMFSFYWDSFIK